MRVFMDFEASSLGKGSFPIEVGWVFEDGSEEGHLIRPAQHWTEWDEGAETVHGISREQLAGEGQAAEQVCGRLVSALSGHDLYASAPSWDGHWLSMLLRAGGQPRHLLRLRDSELAFAEAARDGLGAEASGSAIAEIVTRVREAAEAGPVAHRALADARREREIWMEIRRQAGAMG